MVDIDLVNEPISYDPNHQPVFLKDIWPSDEEIMEVMNQVLSLQNIEGARVLLMLEDSVTTDHISPAGEAGRKKGRIQLLWFPQGQR